jgi:hypothetical protein
VSNHLAIAHVTAALGEIAHTAAKNAVPGTGLTFGRPETANASRRVNVYLFQLVPNAARRNDELPARAGDGKLSGRPRAALDLHFLVSFHGKAEDLEPERMAGAVARELHTNPVLDSLRLTDGATGHAALNQSDLDSAPDRIRVSPMLLSLEETSRLWSVLVQTPHVLSAAYEASMVMIDAVASAPAALPVLRRGKDGRGAIAGTDRVPRLLSAWIGFTGAPDPPAPRASLPAASLGTTVVVEGSDLDADLLELSFRHPLDPAILPPPIKITVPAASRGASQLTFQIPDDSASATAWAAGLYAVTARLERNGKELFSPVWPFLLAPRLRGLVANPPGPSGASIDVTATLTPLVRATQKALLRAGPVEIGALSRAADTDPVVFRLNPAPAIPNSVVRIEVDGVETLPVIIDPATHDFAFDPAQRLTI